MTHTTNERLTIQRLFDVNGWVVVVTGGGTGIGLMCAQTFANNGAKVYIVGRRKEALDQAIEVHGKNLVNGGQLIGIAADVSNKDGISELIKEIDSREKHVNLLINNAGIATSHRTDVTKGEESAEALSQELWNVDPKEWNGVYQTNVVGYFYTAVGFLPLLSAATKAIHGHSSSIINISSISGTTHISQGQFPYNVSKAGTQHLTRLLAHELCRPGVKVRVNTVAPGIFPSEMTTAGSGSDQKSHIPAEDFGKKKGIPAGRPGKEEDMAQAILMLATDTYINGQVIHVDGGFLLEHP